MDDFSDTLERIKLACSEITEKFASAKITESIEKLQKSATQAGKSWCGSWLGYHSCVYYDQLQPVPPVAFSVWNGDS